MFRKITPRKLLLSSLLLVAFGGFLLASPQQASALSNFGPDPVDLGNATDVDGYIITTIDYGSATVPSSTVPIYFKDNLGNKTVLITDGNQCTAPRFSSPADGNAVDTTTFPGNPNGSTATAFYVSNIATGLKSSAETVYSVTDDSSTCDRKTMTLTFQASKYLTYDAALALYVLHFNSDMSLTLKGMENRFRIEVEPTAIVGYSSKIDPTAFGVGHGYPIKTLRDYSLPFAPDCGVLVNTNVTAALYDLDNGSIAVQNGNRVVISVQQISPANVSTNIPLTFSRNLNGTNLITYTGDQNGYDIDSVNSKEYAYIHMTVKPGFRYKLNMKNIYGRNILQFQLPYDSIYFNSPVCPIGPPPPVALPTPPPTKPYFEANGGDVVAGASFATDVGVPCGVAPHITKAGIAGWNQNGVPNFAGSGGQYAAYALSFIQDFVTGQGNGRVPLGQEKNELTFANVNYPAPGPNSVNIAGGLFGGMFGSVACIDYWNAHPAVATALPAGPVSGWPNGEYYASGNITLSAATLAPGQQITLYVEGNVSITGNVVYSTAGWTTRDSIPSFKLITHGTIYIDRGVTELNGLYAAIPTTGESAKVNIFQTPNAGTISTCSTGFNSYDPSKILTTFQNYVPDCAQRLIVTGSVAAQQIWMLRTSGNLGGLASEVFNYSPEAWLAPAGTTAAQNYQSIIGLPPTL